MLHHHFKELLTIYVYKDVNLNDKEAQRIFYMWDVIKEAGLQNRVMGNT